MTQPTNLRDAMDRMLREACEKLQADAKAIAPIPPIPHPVTKLSVWVPTTCCMMTDHTGENHCEHPPPPRRPWHKRQWRRIHDRWSNARMRVGSWIAGTDLDQDNDW